METVTKVKDGTKCNERKKIKIPELALKSFRQWTLFSGIRRWPLFQIDGKYPTYRMIEYRSSRALKAIGSPFSATHVLRHSCLTEHYNSSKDMKGTQAFAGHSDLKSTSRYVKVRDDVMDVQVKQLDKAQSRIVI